LAIEASSWHRKRSTIVDALNPLRRMIIIEGESMGLNSPEQKHPIMQRFALHYAV